MPEEKISIGGRVFEVACQEGEEHYLQAAAQMLDAEAATLADQIGRLSESRILLMAGLMLADKTAALEEQLRQRDDYIGTLDAQIGALKAAPKPAPERVEVPVVPAELVETLAELAARSESLADAVEEKAAG